MYHLINVQSLRRSLQTLCVFYYMVEPMIYLSIFLAMMLSPLCPIPIAYCIYYFVDRGQEKRGGRRIPWLRKLSIWRWIGDYFPFKLIRCEPLNPDRNYLLVCHPHGIVSFSCFNTFGHDAGQFSQLFPGLRPHLLTLNLRFMVPISRDILMGLGACSVGKESIDYLFKKNESGTVLGLVVGGAAESLEAYPKQMVLTLNRRKGFVRVALENGASLVPVLQFGENECFDQKRTLEGSWCRLLQDKFLQITGVAIPFFKGKGFFTDYGFLPYRRPLYTVVGRPIHVDKVINPTNQQIDSLHSLYCEKLRSLYEEYNPKYGNPKVQLVIS